MWQRTAKHDDYSHFKSIHTMSLNTNSMYEYELLNQNEQDSIGTSTMKNVLWFSVRYSLAISMRKDIMIRIHCRKLQCPMSHCPIAGNKRRIFARKNVFIQEGFFESAVNSKKSASIARSLITSYINNLNRQNWFIEVKSASLMRIFQWKVTISRKADYIALVEGFHWKQRSFQREKATSELQSFLLSS